MYLFVKGAPCSSGYILPGIITDGALYSETVCESFPSSNYTCAFIYVCVTCILVLPALSGVGIRCDKKDMQFLFYKLLKRVACTFHIHECSNVNSSAYC